MQTEDGDTPLQPFHAVDIVPATSHQTKKQELANRRDADAPTLVVVRVGVRFILGE